MFFFWDWYQTTISIQIPLTQACAFGAVGEREEPEAHLGGLAPIWVCLKTWPAKPLASFKHSSSHGSSS